MSEIMRGVGCIGFPTAIVAIGFILFFFYVLISGALEKGKYKGGSYGGSSQTTSPMKSNNEEQKGDGPVRGVRDPRENK